MYMVFLYRSASVSIVSFAAVIRVVTQRSSPLTTAYSSSAFLSSNRPIRRGFHSLETLSLAATLKRNMIGGLLTITCKLLVLSNKGKGMQSLSEQLLVGSIVA